MNTFKSTFIATVISSVFMGAAFAGDNVFSVIHPESADIFNAGIERQSGRPVDLQLDNETTSEQVWSVEYEEYIDSETMQTSMAESSHVFKYDEAEKEYTY